MFEMKLLTFCLFSVLLEFCFSAPVNTKDAVESSPSKRLFDKLPAERQRAYKNYFANAKTEAEHIRAAGKMSKEDPEMFEIKRLRLQEQIQRLGLSAEAKEYLSFFYNSIANMTSGSDKELLNHHKIVRAKWNNLDKKTRDEIRNKVIKVKVYIDDPLDEMIKAYSTLTPEQQLFYKTYFSDKNVNQPESKTIRLLAQLHKEHPDVYRIYKIINANIVKYYDGSKQGREFLQFYYEQMDKMPDNSQANFDTFLAKTKEEWNKLDGTVKDEFIIDLPGSAQLLGETIDPDQLFDQIPAERKKLYIEYLKRGAVSEKEAILVAAEMHKNHPDDFYKIQKLTFKKLIRKFEGGREIKDFYKYCFDRIDDMQDGTEVEYAKYLADVKIKWLELSQQAKDQWTLLRGPMNFN